MRGVCACGAVVVAAAELGRGGVHCHCTTCTRIAGGGAASSVLVPREALTITCREDALSGYRSSPNTVRWHCATCHAPIYAEVTDLPELGFFVSAALFEAGALAEVRFEHMFVRSTPSWHRIADDAPKHDAEAPASVLGLLPAPRRAPGAGSPPRFVRPA
jgi:hypothetical protein